MRKTLSILSLIIILTLTSCQSSLTTNQPPARPIQLESIVVMPPMQLSPDIDVPGILPTTIADPILLEGWIRLYHSTQPCQLWDGYTLTGQELAQYVIDHTVVITWNIGQPYPDSWIDRGNTGNIYINPNLKEETETQMIRLMSVMAHEIFHSTTPFDQNADTLYEEYWAFYVGACVSGQSTERYQYAYPLSAICLTQWFQSNRHDGYLGQYELYPENVVAKSKP
jgi:hypothetical protein